MSNDSQESPGSRNRFHPSVLTQMQIERLKREDEDEHWISGEELYTEGSSDDEEDLKRLSTTRDPCCMNNVENSLSNFTTKVIESAAAINRSKWSHRRSGEITKRRDDHIFGEKSKIDKPDPMTNESVIKSQLQLEEKLSSNISCCSSNYNSEKNHDTESENDYLNSAAMTTSETSAAVNINSGKKIIDDSLDRDKEISWRPKRDENYHVANLIIEDSIVELRELQFEYLEIVDSISELKTSLTPLDSWNNGIRRIESATNPGLNDSYNNYNENENSVDSLLSEATKLHLEIKESAKTAGAGSLDQKIIEDVSISDLKDICRWSNSVINTAKIKKEIMEIIKLDTFIEKLDQKVKKAMEETYQEQISNRKELRRLQTTLTEPESGKLAKNSQEFLKLCSMEIESVKGQDIERVSTVHPIYQSQNESENLREEFEDLGTSEEEEEEESRESRREKLEEQLTIIDKRRANFIERNKELASCATQGGLAITDEEKKRLEELIEDDSDDGHSRIGKSCSSSASSSTPYTIDKEADDLLKNLTEQLANINSETYRKAEEKKNMRDEFRPQKEQLLINSLQNLSESRSKIIYPISEEEMRQLISEYYAEQEASSSRISVNDVENEISNDLNLELLRDDKSTSVSIISATRTITRDVINELIRDAKTTMPLFQFKYQTESIEELEDQNKEGEEKPRFLDS